MSLKDKETMWVLLGVGSAAVAGLAARHVMRYGWRKVTDNEPPLNPVAPDVRWRDAIIWTVLSGALVGVARLLMRRGAAAGWRRIQGGRPPRQ